MRRVRNNVQFGPRDGSMESFGCRRRSDRVLIPNQNEGGYFDLGERRSRIRARSQRQEGAADSDGAGGGDDLPDLLYVRLSKGEIGWSENSLQKSFGEGLHPFIPDRKNRCRPFEL